MKKIIIFSLIAISIFLPCKQLFADATTTVTIPPHVSDYQFAFASTTPGTQFSQNTTLTYQITYGAKASGNIPSTVTLVADYSDDLAPTSVHVLDYVVNSASNAYNNTHPVIDTINRTITWTIVDFPAGVTDQTVTFQLRTNANYTGTDVVPFTIVAKMSNQYVTLPNIDVNQSYLYDSGKVTPTPTPSPTSVPTTTPTPGPTSVQPTNTPGPQATSTPAPTITLTPTPTPTSPNFVIENVSVIGKTQDNATISVGTSLPALLQVHYGTSSTNINNITKTDSYNSNSQITLNQLTPNTQYYFFVTATTQSGQTARSDIYTFQTALPSQPTVIETGTLVVSNNTIVVASQPLENISTSTVVLLTNTNYQLVFAIPPSANITSIEAVIRNNTVLGISTDTPTNEEIIFPLKEPAPGVYVGNITMPTEPGTYALYIRITDKNGNIVEQKLNTMKVVAPLTIYSKATSQPVSNARVYLYVYNRQNNTYEPLSKIFNKVQNPSFSNSAGTVAITLPQGQYKAHITAPGFKGQDVLFSIEQNHNENYPRVGLIPEGFNLFTFLSYYGGNTSDALSITQSYVQGFSWLSAVNAWIIIIILVIVTFLAFSSKIRIPLHSLHSYFSHHIINKNVENSLQGTIVNKTTGLPIPSADVYVLNTDHKIIEHTNSNSIGIFALSRLPEQYSLEICAEGREPMHLQQEAIQADTSGQYVFSLEQRTTQMIWKEKTLLLTRKFLGMCFEYLLITSFILEIFFGYTLGWEKALPLMLLSIVNLILWLIHVSTH